MNSPQPYVLYEVRLQSLILTTEKGTQFNASKLLANGRANYILFENFIAHLIGLRSNSQGAASDLCDSLGRGYEVKSFRDIDAHPSSKHDEFHTAASSTFGPNNHGPKVKKFLEDGEYERAFKLCCETGFDKNDFYIYVNSAQFNILRPLKFIVIPTTDVMARVSRDDPRKISRREILDLARETVAL